MLPTADAQVAGESPAASGCRPGSSRSGHRRQPLRPADRPPRHRATAHPRVRLVLPRHGRRDARGARPDGRVVPRPGRSAPRSTPHDGVVPFNDVPALEAASPVAHRLRAGRAGDDQHRHRAPRARVPRRLRRLPGHGTLLVLDETHTICAGPGGYGAHGLAPTCSWSASPSAVDAAARVSAAWRGGTRMTIDVSGIGGRSPQRPRRSPMDAALAHACAGGLRVAVPSPRASPTARRRRRGHGLPWHVRARLPGRVWFATADGPRPRPALPELEATCPGREPRLLSLPQHGPVHAPHARRRTSTPSFDAASGAVPPYDADVSERSSERTRDAPRPRPITAPDRHRRVVHQ